VHFRDVTTFHRQDVFAAIRDGRPWYKRDGTDEHEQCCRAKSNNSCGGIGCHHASTYESLAEMDRHFDQTIYDRASACKGFFARLDIFDGRSCLERRSVRSKLSGHLRERHDDLENEQIMGGAACEHEDVKQLVRPEDARHEDGPLQQVEYSADAV
jgi:hypothetical protein